MSEVPTILVCGSRNLGNYRLYKQGVISKEECEKQKIFIYKIIDNICLEKNWITEKDEYGNWLPVVKTIHGGASGVDDIADQWSIINWIAPIVFKADWNKYGKSAGPIRNKQMLKEGKPDLVVAFYYNLNNKSRGTSHMVKIAKEAGVPTLEYGYLNE